EEGEGRFLRGFYLFAVIWLPVFLVTLRSLSGITILLVLVFVFTLILVQSLQARVGRFVLTVIIILIPLFVFVYTGNAIQRFYTFEQVDFDNLDSFTAEGNRYIHHTEKSEKENGHYVWLYVCPEELKRAWEQVSEYDYMGKTKNGNDIRFTLIRYLTSKGFRKDAGGVNRLDSIDVAAIEQGIANHIYLNRFALYPRIYELIWEFDRYRLGHSPNDKSLIQRYFYLKAGLSIASDNLWYGVGTGDVRQAFRRYYEENDSPLRHDRRRRAHNQYLTFMVAFGIPGLLVCLFALIYPVFLRRRWGSYMALVFLLTMALSMLDEDTLENNPGVVMFSFFYALFIFGPGWRWKGSRKKSRNPATSLH
ncbi:MAG: O-antigen ligase family protein, partial [Bacteroidales bacterium]|nr:O-antigen ligase family protein [Bacteroidales bacterium]